MPKAVSQRGITSEMSFVLFSISNFVLYFCTINYRRTRRPGCCSLVRIFTLISAFTCVYQKIEVTVAMRFTVTDNLHSDGARVVVVVVLLGSLFIHLFIIFAAQCLGAH